MEVKILAKQALLQLKSSESFLTLQIVLTAERPKKCSLILTVTGFFDSLIYPYGYIESTSENCYGRIENQSNDRALLQNKGAN